MRSDLRVWACVSLCVCVCVCLRVCAQCLGFGIALISSQKYLSSSTIIQHLGRRGGERKSKKPKPNKVKRWKIKTKQKTKKKKQKNKYCKNQIKSAHFAGQNKRNKSLLLQKFTLIQWQSDGNSVATTTTARKHTKKLVSIKPYIRNPIRKTGKNLSQSEPIPVNPRGVWRILESPGESWRIPTSD